LGKEVVEKLVNFLANAIRAIKEDRNVPEILNDFYERAHGSCK